MPGNRGKKKKAPNGKHAVREYIRSASFINLWMFLCASLLLLLFFSAVCTPRKYDLSVGSISHETINATKDVVDEVGTEERRQAAANAVEPTYRFQEGVKEEVLNSLSNWFNQLRTIQQYGVTLAGSDGKRTDSSFTKRTDSSFTDEEIDYAIKLAGDLNLSRYQITTLLKVDTDAFDEMVSTVTIAVNNSLNTTIREGQVTQSIQTILQIVGYKVDVSLTQNILPTVLRSCIRPNMIIDQEATAQARQNAMDAVESVIYLQGQNIIREGDRITRNQLEMLRTLGLLKERTNNFSVYGGSLLVIAISMVVLLLSICLIQKELLTDNRKTMVLLLIVVICVGFAAAAHLVPSVYLIPMTLGPILAGVLLGHMAGVILILPLSLLISGMITGNSSSSNFDVVILFFAQVSGSIFSVAFIHGHPQRVRVLLSGLIAALAGVLSVLTFHLLASSDSQNLVELCAWTAAGGILSGVLAIALQPAFESVFRLATPSKLLEMTNPNQPLMKRLMIEAPGTYHHSIIVANLAEAAAQRIHANPYLARAGAYYHDIGKLKRPAYFKENQMGENPHEKTDPYVSAAILTNHTKDGVLIAQKEHLPPEVQDIIRQHHGVTPVMFFYHKALQMSDGNPVDINEFRYDGPKPQTKEAAIVMLADTIEAAVRSMKDPTPKAIDQFIERLVRGKLEDGQLSDCPLSLKDIDQICEAFSSILKGVYHERIEYPVVQHYATGSAVIQKPATAVPVPEQEPQKEDSIPVSEPAEPETTEEQNHED